MSEESGEPRDGESVERLDRRLQHQEKQMELAHDFAKQVPELMARFVNDCVVPIMRATQQPQQAQQPLWEPPEETRGKPGYTPPQAESEGQSDSETAAADVRGKLGLDENGGVER